MEAGGGGSWYLAREEIERCSPSRRDCVPAAKEAELRATYCSFIRDVGIRLQLPQVTIATAIVLCHRFYLRQSHAKNEWQTVATVCIFLASKIEDTPCQLQRVVIVAYETMYRKDCDAAKRIYQKEILEKQKELILVGETLLLSTIRFDFNIQHPYEPLKLALKNLGMSQKEVKQVAVNLINDTLRTTLVVEFKPHYIAAGALFLAAKFNDVKLPSEKGKVWWHVFDVAPKQLQAVIHQMAELYMKRNPCSMDPAIKPIPGPIPTDKQQTIKTSDPSRRSLSNKFDREASRCMPVDRHRARKEPIKTIPAPLPIEKRQVNTLDPSRRRLPNNFDREASRCMLVDNSASHHSTVGSARNEAIKPIPAPVLMEKQQVNTSDSSRRHLHNNFDREASRYMSVDNSASYHSSVCSARNGAIKPLPAPIPMENQRIVNTSDPSRRRLRNNFDREASRCMPVDSSASRRLTVCSARNEAIKPPAPILMEKQQIINTSDLSRRVLSKKIDREASRCMPVDSSASHYSTVCSAKKELNKSLQTHVDRTLHCVAREGRLEKQSSRAALEADHVYHVYGRPQDINVTTIRTYIRRKRTNQEIGDHPSRSNKSDKDAWIRKQHGSVIVVDTKLSSFKKQKL